MREYGNMGNSRLSDGLDFGHETDKVELRSRLGHRRRRNGDHSRARNATEDRDWGWCAGCNGRDCGCVRQLATSSWLSKYSQITVIVFTGAVVVEVVVTKLAVSVSVSVMVGKSSTRVS